MGHPDINQLITDWGYAGIFLVVILGNIGLPVPEETVLAVAGYLVWSCRLHRISSRFPVPSLVG